MQMSDVIADMLTRIRNANDAKHQTVDVPASNMKRAIADILLEEGYIKAFQVNRIWKIPREAVEECSCTVRKQATENKR